jgi:hypothetical protein
VTEFCGQFDANLHFTELIAKMKSGIHLFQTFEKSCDFLSDSPFKKQKKMKKNVLQNKMLVANLFENRPTKFSTKITFFHTIL